MNYDDDRTVILENDIGTNTPPASGIDGNTRQETPEGKIISGVSVEDEPRYLRPGMLLNGRYRISQVVGAGGFGVTYAARDETLDQQVAIKEYLPGEFSTRMPGNTRVTVYGGEKEEQYRDGLRKYLDESRRLAALRGVEGIVQIFDSFNENETAYIVMEFLRGETLAERLKRDGKIAPREAVEIMLPVLGALTEVHKQNILHRDIAPNNIFLCSDGKVKLLDFGAARSVTGTYSKSLTVLYKEGYTAEEQYRSRGEQGPWTDVYACAATLYRMITGEVPDGAMERRRKDTLKAPSKCGVKVPANVDAAIMNALNLDIKARTQSAGDFADELLGRVSVRRHFVRVEERRAGYIPTWVWIVSGIAAATLIVLVALGATGAVDFHAEGFSNLFVADGKTRVMNVVNLEQEEAVDRLAAINLSMEVTDVKYSNRVLEGRIISQEEKKGSIVDTDSAVHVVVSKGAGEVNVPDMIGMSWETAKAELDDLCLEYNKLEMKNEEAPGFVIAQDIGAGTLIEQGREIQVSVSSGMNYNKSETWEIDDLTGMSLSEVRELLAEHGIYARETGEDYSDTVAADGVVSQSAGAGSTVHGEDIVELTMSLGPAPVEMIEVVGKSRDDAVAELEGIGLAAAVTERESDGKAGLVLSQSVETGETIHRGDEVSLVVSRARRVAQQPIQQPVGEAVQTTESVEDSPVKPQPSDVDYEDWYKNQLELIEQQKEQDRIEKEQQIAPDNSPSAPTYTETPQNPTSGDSGGSSRPAEDHGSGFQ